jgi:hypothetical protein
VTESEKRAEAHSPEPWSRDAEAGECACYIRDAKNWLLVGEDDYGPTLDVDDARRIVACVNACAGIPTDALESGSLGEALRLAAVAVSDLNDHPCLRDDLYDRLSKAGGLDALVDALRALGRIP